MRVASVENPSLGTAISSVSAEPPRAQIITRGRELGVDFGLTFSCYDPHPETGRPCEHCDSCLLRARGFAEAGMVDPATRRD